MSEKSKGKAENPDFRTLIPDYSDEQIKEILRLRKHYQPEAAELAIKEAIQRGLIHSEQDLFAEQFNVKPLKFSIFPGISDEKNRRKIRRSISRALIIAGALPVIYGIVKISENKLLEGITLTALGLLWIFASVLQYRQLVRKVLIIHFILLLISAIYLISKFSFKGTWIFMDFFAMVMFYVLFIYGLLFLNRIGK